jgi:ADP-ribose pyrophosphatase YjhB (NUDIX family)
MEDHHVVAAILRRADQVLLCHRSPRRQWYPDVWDFPGGHVLPGERPEDALRREVAEELGAELEGLDGEPVLHQIDPQAGLDLTVWSHAAGGALSRTCSQKSMTPSAGSNRSSLTDSASLTLPTWACSGTS